MRKVIRRLGSAAEAEQTRAKLRELEALVAAAVEGDGEDAGVRRRTLVSLKRVINQLKEEIVLWEVKGARGGGG